MTINHQFFIIIILIIVAAILSALLIRQWQQHKKEISAINSLLIQARSDIDSTNERLSAVFQISQKFVEAKEEGVIVNELLSLSMTLTNAIGASFVPFDGRGQPLAAIRKGDFPFPVPDAWLEYIASPGVRGTCMTCTLHESVESTCPLFKGPFSDALRLYCNPLHRGDREYGILTLYRPDNAKLDESTDIFIKSLLDATALAIESIRLRDNEHKTLNQLRSVQQQTDSKIFLRELLDDVCRKLGAHYGLLIPIYTKHIDENSFFPLGEIIIRGEIPSSLVKNLDAMSQHISINGEEVSENLISSEKAGDIRILHLLGMPVVTSNKIPKGKIIIIREGGEAFQQHHYSLLKELSPQIGLVFHITELLAEITYKAIIDERIRLAREIHDGLAQTLGFLKLLVAQMQGYIDKRDYNRLNRVTQTFSQTVSGAYQDVREAIDGLRVIPEGKNGQPNSDLFVWIDQTVLEFQENQEFHSFTISLEKDEININLSTEIQAQLIRIIQEALSNIRKHAHANHVVISVRENHGDLILEVRDNGLGFSPQEVPGPSQHGLKGMRERTELIGADFQVISLSGTGTIVRIRLPHSIKKQLEKGL